MHEYLRSPKWRDFDILETNMRKEDIEEVEANGLTPSDALFHSFTFSKVVYTLTDISGHPLAMVGVGPSPKENSGLIWLLGTDLVNENKITFLRHSKKALQLLYIESGYQTLHNYVYSKNTLHIAWLKWLGFEFGERVNIPPFNKEFIEFSRSQDI